MSIPPSVADPRAAALHDWLTALAPAYSLRLDALEPISSDASARRYFRILSASQHGGTLIAMDAPPPEKCREYAQVAQLMQAAELNVPRVLEADYARGFMLITDLGRATYLEVLDAGDTAAAQPLMRAALEALIRWQLASREGILPRFDETLLRRELEQFPAWYLGRHLGAPPNAADRAALDTVLTTLVRNATSQTQVFMHRDYMPRNLIATLSGASHSRAGQHNAPCTTVALAAKARLASTAARSSWLSTPGILDFQDAVWGPISYDVVSLLRDAFISWDEAFERDCCEYYWKHAKQSGLPVPVEFSTFYRELEWTGLQRHLKILGQFARLHYQAGKSRYLADLPRFLGYARRVATRYQELTPLVRLLF